MYCSCDLCATGRQTSMGAVVRNAPGSGLNERPLNGLAYLRIRRVPPFRPPLADEFLREYGTVQ